MSDKLICTEHIVAFIDVLGTKEKISISEIDSLNIVHNSYDEAIKYMEMIFDKKWFENKRPKAKIFSDNIILYCPVFNNDYKIAFIDTLMLVAMIQTQFLDNGYLVRGGITTGSFFADDVMVWGNALVEAYKLESECATYPRIIIGSSIANKLNLCDFIPFIYQDDDKKFFVDYLSNVFGLNSEIRFSIVNKAWQSVENDIKQYSNNRKILDKLMWHKKYLTNVMDDLIGFDEIAKILNINQ